MTLDLSHIRVTPSKYSEHQLIKSMYALYLHDLSEFGGGYTLSKFGVWEPDYLPLWLSRQQGALTLTIHHDETPIGFACVGRGKFPYKSPRRDQKLCEFFILRAYRRNGLGHEAGKQVLAQFEGRWELTILEHNRPALKMWRSVLRDLEPQHPHEDHTGDDVRITFVMSKRDFTTTPSA